MMEKTKEYYFQCAEKCVRNNMLEPAIIAYNNALLIDPDYPEADKRLSDVYNLYETPGLSLVKRSDYNGKIQLPKDVDYILQCSNQLSRLPDFGSFNTELLGFNGFCLTKKYSILENKKFAVDFSCKNDLKKIPETMFAGLTNLVCADFSGCHNVTQINEGAFSGCQQLQSIVLPKNITTIGQFAFDSAGLKYIDLSDTAVESIGGCAFMGNSYLSRIELPKHLKELGSSVFAECYSLKNLKFNDDADKIDPEAFRKSYIKEIFAPANFKYRPDNDIIVNINGTVPVDEYLRVANYYIKNQNNELAEKYFSLAISEHPKRYEGYLERSKFYLNTKGIKEAIPDAKKLVSLKPTNEEYVSYLFSLCSKESDYINLMEFLKDVHSKNPRNSIINLYIAKTYLETGDAYFGADYASKAMEHIQMSVKFGAMNSQYYLYRGLAYKCLEDNEKALADLNVSIVLKPENNETAYFYRGLVYVKMLKSKEALADFNRASNIFANMPYAYLARSCAYYMEGKYDLSVKDCTRYIEHYDDKNFLAYYNRAMAYSKIERGIDFAISDFRSAIEFKPDFADLYFRKGTLENIAKFFYSSSSDFCNAIRLNPKEEDYYLGLADAYVGLKSYFKATKTCNSYIKLQKKDISKTYRTYAKRGDIYFKRGRYNSALKDYTAALSQKKDWKELYLKRASIYAIKKQHHPALADYKKVLELDPHCKEVYLNRPKVYAFMERPDLAIRDYEKAIELYPKCNEAREELYKLKPEARVLVPLKDLKSLKRDPRTIPGNARTVSAGAIRKYL